MDKCLTKCPLKYNYCGITSFKNQTRTKKLIRECTNIIRDEDGNRPGYSNVDCLKKNIDEDDDEDNDDGNNNKNRDDKNILEVCQESCTSDKCNSIGRVKYFREAPKI